MLELQILDVTGNIACAKSTTFEYVDYIQLAKFNGEWRIINILWDKNEIQ